MPLTAASEPQQYFNLLTGVLIDQPVTLANVLSVGGDQRLGAPGLRVYGGLEIYASRHDAHPALVLDPDLPSWDTLYVEHLEAGEAVAGDFVLHSGQRLSEMLVPPQFRELRPGVLATPGSLIIGATDPWAIGLDHGQAALVVRGPDLKGPSSVASFQCWSGNWLQFNVRFWDDNPAQGWSSKRLTLDFDVDTQVPGRAGRITLQDGKVGLGNTPDVEARFAELEAHIHRLELQLAVANRRLLGRR